MYKVEPNENDELMQQGEVVDSFRPMLDEGDAHFICSDCNKEVYWKEVSPDKYGFAVE
jgi:hypothetical protein